MFKNIGSNSDWSSSSCPATLGVWSCTVGKLICPLWSSPSLCSCSFYLLHCSKEHSVRPYLLDTFSGTLVLDELVQQHSKSDLPWQYVVKNEMSDCRHTSPKKGSILDTGHFYHPKLTQCLVFLLYILPQKLWRCGYSCNIASEVLKNCKSWTKQAQI